MGSHNIALTCQSDIAAGRLSFTSAFLVRYSIFCGSPHRHEPMWSAIAAGKKQNRTFFAFLLTPSQRTFTTNLPRARFTPNAAGRYCGLMRSRRAAVCVVGQLLDRQNKTVHIPGLMVRSQDSRTNRPGL